MKDLLEYADLAAILVLFIVVAFQPLSFIGKVFLIVVLALLLTYTAWKRYRVRIIVDDRLRELADGKD